MWTSPVNCPGVHTTRHWCGLRSCFGYENARWVKLSEPNQTHSMSLHEKCLTFIRDCDDHHNGDGCTAISRNSFHLSTYDRLMLNSFWRSCLAQLRSHRSSCVDYKMIEKVICAFYLSQVSCKHMTIHVIRPITDLDLESWNSFGLWLLSGPAMESCLASNMINFTPLNQDQRGHWGYNNCKHSYLITPWLHGIVPLTY